MKKIIPFLVDLKLNNNKAWFDAHKKQYEEAKVSFIEIVEDIINGLKSFEPGIENITAKSCLFRINRDVRFSPDKSPYKINFGASFNPDGKKSPKAGYYLHIQPGECFLGGGIYMPEPETLKTIRQEIDYNFDEFKGIITTKEFKKWYPNIFAEGKLSRPPKDYDANNPAIEYLKLKHFIFGHDFKEDTFKNNNKLAESCIDAYKTLKPFNDFLNRSFDK